MTKATVFAVTCVLHSMVVLFCRFMMMFHSQAIYSLGRGTKVARRLLGSTLRDRLLIGTFDSFASRLLFTIGMLRLIVSLIRDREERGG
ncbi:hypothetical protein MLD38_028658 [Melastoma candidum]|uniref:Uncharacterized protein n=1 Tax=Melastoma candidum TaxID=119954 RepID=A0ACB9N2Z9_9MYRT|nr:hypothetical protein MLD38_028658 [Melastoma candidum]